MPVAMTILWIVFFRWAPSKWEEGFLHYEEYVKQTGSNIIVQKFKNEEGYNLGGWVNTQITLFNKGKIIPKRKKS